MIFLSYLAIYLVWGSNFFFIKMAAETIHPIGVVGLRFLIGGLGILLFAFLSGRVRRIPTSREIGTAVLIGIFLLVVGNGLTSMAVRKVDSYLIALLSAVTPLAVAFFDWIFLRKAISATGFGGIFLGIIGVGFLLYNGQSISGSFPPEILMALVGLFSWSLLTSLGHTIKVYPDSLVNSGIQMFSAGAICLVGLFFFEPAFFETLDSVSFRSSMGLSYLSVLGSLAFCAFIFLISREPAVRVATYAFVNPVIAILLGFLLGHETPVPFLSLGIPLILLGLLLMLYGEMIWGMVKKVKSLKGKG